MGEGVGGKETDHGGGVLLLLACLYGAVSDAVAGVMRPCVRRERASGVVDVVCRVSVVVAGAG